MSVILQAPPKEKTWHYITERDQLKNVCRYLEAYLSQSYVNSFGEKELALLAVDFETFFLNTKYLGKAKRPIPRPIWLGDKEGYEGAPRIFGIGTDPLPIEFELKNKQFLIDATRFSRSDLKYALKDIIEAQPILAHNAKYEWQWLYEYFGIEAEVICTMLTSQVLRAGFRVSHNLVDCYYSFLDEQVFKSITGMDYPTYKEFKKTQQESAWGQPILTNDQLVYSAQDVEGIFYLREAMCQAVDRFRLRWERHLPPGVGINQVLQLEYAAVPIFAIMELYGIKVDHERITNYLMPILEDEATYAAELLEEHPAFHCKEDATNPVLFFERPEGVHPADFEKLQAKIKAHLKNKFAPVGLSVRKHESGDKTYTCISWLLNKSHITKANVLTPPKNWPSKADVLSAIQPKLEELGFSYISTRLININSNDQLPPAVQECLGINYLPTNQDNKVSIDELSLIKLKVENPDNPNLAYLDYIDRYRTATSAASKLESLLSFVKPTERVHSYFNQCGQETEEVVSGRSSCTDYNWFSASGRDTWFKYDDQEGWGAGEFSRNIAIADEGCTFVNADMSQIEPKIVAQVSKDQRWISDIRSGVDLHKRHAQLALNKASIEDVTKHERDYVGKPFNLGRTYGMRGKKFSWSLLKLTKGMTILNAEQCNKILDNIDKFYPTISAEKERTGREAVAPIVRAGGLYPFLFKTISVEHSMMGRPRSARPTSGLEKLPPDMLARSYKPYGHQGFFYNKCMEFENKLKLRSWNHRIQGTGADILKIAEVMVYHRMKQALSKFPEYNPRLNYIAMVLHDELLVQCQEQFAQIVKNIVETSLVDAGKMFVQVVDITVGISIGKTWLKASPK